MPAVDGHTWRVSHDEPRVPTTADVNQAIERVRGRIRRTPVLHTDVGDLGLDASVALKLECLQHAGSFKARGALNSALGSGVPAAGLIAASGGNHGVAVARTGRVLGVPAEIFVPEVSAPAKVERVRAQGATVHIAGALYSDAQEACDLRAAESGALNIHPYNAPLTVAGQATLGVELIEQVPDVDTVLVAVGGGGLAAGLGVGLPSSVRIVAVETEGCPALHAAVAAGRPVTVEPTGVAADALGAKQVGALPWQILEGRAESIVVPDAAVLAARQALWAEMQIVAEPAAATPLAALRTGEYRPEPGERVVVVVCGANTDPSDLMGPPPTAG